MGILNYHLFMKLFRTLYLINGSRYVISVPVRICDSIECSSMCKELIQNLSNRTTCSLPPIYRDCLCLVTDSEQHRLRFLNSFLSAKKSVLEKRSKVRCGQKAKRS